MKILFMKISTWRQSLALFITINDGVYVHIIQQRTHGECNLLTVIINLEASRLVMNAHLTILFLL